MLNFKQTEIIKYEHSIYMRWQTHLSAEVFQGEYE